MRIERLAIRGGLRVGTLFLGVLFLASCGETGGEMAIFDVMPRAADVSGNEAVHVQGKNFRKDIGYTVYFGTARAESVTLIDESTLRVKTPRVEEPGPVEVTVLADNGPGFRVLGGFSFVDEQAGGSAANEERGNLRY